MIPSGDRQQAVMAVLSGRTADEVAAEFAVEPEVVSRWVDLFVEGGRLRLAGMLDPASFEGRDRFLVLLGHEFRTPLSVIRGWAETALSGGLPEEGYEAAMRAIVVQVARLERLARDALDAGAVAQGRLQLVVGPFGMREVIESVAASMPEGSVSVTPGEEVEVVADRTRLEQVVGDVMAHGVRLAGDSGVTVSLDCSHSERVTVTATVEGRELRYDQAAELFEPYGRSDTSVGTGLGLYLPRALLAAHGGEIGLRSDRSRTEFWFQLPRGGPDAGPRVERFGTARRLSAGPKRPSCG